MVSSGYSSYYIAPFEMTLELADYLEEMHQISNFSLALSETYDLPISKRLEEASGTVKSFYDMISSLGMAEMFERKHIRWWKGEF